ncbi:uncharacterized protein Tco025E_10062 [Trypanosoma conorhini]|uniref:Uncharacterized protein n=1 Tax=Trypanosoma conorhini TaxID=83891 RepID=A0A422MQ70_9TRYP|nr:uncharacterized protein Tco025E_10062 [Trypanosoma conorhini]RNE95344.1 hypothetical protein Tco025E_10062 [Trypanosoma conorhini]
MGMRGGKRSGRSFRACARGSSWAPTRVLGSTGTLSDQGGRERTQFTTGAFRACWLQRSAFVPIEVKLRAAALATSGASKTEDALMDALSRRRPGLWRRRRGSRARCGAGLANRTHTWGAGLSCASSSCAHPKRLSTSCREDAFRADACVPLRRVRQGSFSRP